MKQFLPLLALCFAMTASAIDRVTATLTVTNIPSAANTFVLNASTRTWRASVTTPSTEVLIGASIGASATNLFRQFASYQFSGPVTLGFSSSNIITIQGASAQAMAASLTGTWGAITYTTNTVTAAYMVRVPFTAEPTVPQTNNPTLLATGMGTYSQSPFATNTTLVRNLVQTDGHQSIAGTKMFTWDPYITNSAPTLNFWDTDGASDEKWAYFSMDGGQFRLDFADDVGGSFANVFYVTRTGETATAMTLVPPLTATTILNCSLTNATITNSVMGGSYLFGTNYSTGIFGHTRANNTSLANGNNATIDFGAKVFVKIKTGPSSAFAICGIAGGADGRELVLYNATGQAMTISNDSGVEPTAANRIYTNTGGDVVTTGNGAVRLIYDSEDSRWVVLSLQQ